MIISDDQEYQRPHEIFFIVFYDSLTLHTVLAKFLTYCHQMFWQFHILSYTIYTHTHTHTHTHLQTLIPLRLLYSFNISISLEIYKKHWEPWSIKARQKFQSFQGKNLFFGSLLMVFSPCALWCSKICYPFYVHRKSFTHWLYTANLKLWNWP